MERPPLQRALECLRDAGAAMSDRADAVRVVRDALTVGGIAARDAREAVSALHRARDHDPAGALADPLIEALAAAVGLRVGGDPRRACEGAWGLPALLAADDAGACSVARSTRADHTGESWRIDGATASRARALAARLERARPAEVSWQVDGARVNVTRGATQRSATGHWQELGSLPLPVDADGLPRPLTNEDVAAQLDRWCEEITLGSLRDEGPLSARYVELVDYVHGAEESGVRMCGLPSLGRLVTAGADLAQVRAVMVDDISALASIVEAAAGELGGASVVSIDDDTFTVRGARDARERRGELAALLRQRLQEAGYGHDLHVRPIHDGWQGQIQIYTTRARVEELARCNVMFLHYLPRDVARVIFLGRAGGSVYLGDHVERTLTGTSGPDARVFVLSRHTAPPRLIALVRELIDARAYSDRALAAGAFSYREWHGVPFDDAVLDGIDAAMHADPTLAAQVQSLYDLAVGAGLLDGLSAGAEVLIVDERGHGTFPLMLRHALERAPRRSAPAVGARWFVGGNRSLMSDYPRLDPARLTADFGWANPARVVEAVSRQAEHVPQPLAGPRYRGRDVAPLGHALELDSLRVRAGALVKNLWLYDGWLRGHAELPLIALAAARDDSRASPVLRDRAGRSLAARLTDEQAHRYGILDPR